MAHALRIAQNSAVNESGFLVLDLYKETPFHKYFTQNGNEINFSSIALNDFGIGMTGELSCLKWVVL
jgi:hypothetical protein